MGDSISTVEAVQYCGGIASVHVGIASVLWEIASVLWGGEGTASVLWRNNLKL